MFLLRFISVSLIGLFLLNIFFKQRRNETQNPIIIVAIDNSSSMTATKDSSFFKNEFAGQLQELRKELSEKYTLKTIQFGDKINVTDQALSFTDKETDIESLIKEVENNFSGQNTGALVIVSDGIYNKGSNPLYISEKLGYPIYAIAAGDTNEIKDVAIRKIDHNRIAYLGNFFPVEVFVTAKKFAGREVVVSLLQNNIEKSKQILKINTADFLSSAIFTLQASANGLVKYTTKVSILEGENNILNNSQSFVMEIIDNREKILLLANTPHPDVSAIKEVLSESSAYELEYSMAADFKKSVKPYSLVIFHGFSNNQLMQLNDCKNNQIPYWIINPSTADNLPGVKIVGGLGRSNDAEPMLNSAFTLFNVSDGLKNLLRDLPAVEAPFGNYVTANNSLNLINQRIGVVETESPILVFTEVNGLKTAVFIGDGLWKWKFRDFAEHNNIALFQELISKSVQYLSVKSDKSFFRIDSPKMVNENEMIELSAEVYNKSYEAILEPDVSLILTDADDKKFNYNFSKTAGAYRLNIGILRAGEYRYTASVNYNNELFTKAGLIVVKEVVAEQNNTVANHRLLYQMANRSNGKVYYPDQISELKAELLKNENIKPVTYSQITSSMLIDLKEIFWVILILLSVEWFFRKRYFSI